MYDSPYDIVHLERCSEPGWGALHGGLDWDEGNLSHINDLTRGQIEAGLDRGYFSLGPNPEYEDQCQFLYLFQPVPPWERFAGKYPIYRLVIETSKGTIRPITVMQETNAGYIKEFRVAQKRGELE